MTTEQEQVNEVVGKQTIAAGKLSRTALIQALEAQTQVEYKDDAPDNGAIVKMLSAYYAKLPEPQLLECKNCLGFSDANLAGCPFCGEGDVEVEEAKTTITAPKLKTKPVRVWTEPPKKAAASKKAPAPKPAPAAAAKPPKGAPAKKAPKPNGVAPGHPTTALAVTKLAVDGQLMTESDLDEAVEEIKHLFGEGARSMWAIGVKLLEVFTSGLWKQRNEKGKVKYKRFDQFVELECGISKASAYHWMLITREFDEAAVKKFGSVNLSSILTVPKEARPELMALIEGQGKDGKKLSTREIQAEAKKIRERTKTTVRRGVGGRRTAAASAAAAEAKAKHKRETVSCMVFTNKQSIKLLTKETAKLDEDKQKRARKMGDKPVAVYQCSNQAVTLHFALQEDDKGNWILAMEARRDDDK